MTFTTLKDGGLSVRIGGVEREADVTGLDLGEHQPRAMAALTSRSR